MKLFTKPTTSQMWLLLGYTICVLSPFCMQQHTARQIIVCISVGVLLYVTVRLVRARRHGGCAA